ncbi:hypothetical protein [Brevibacillus laterosporus]|uniref:hypothetical protein n=1 Tax=Brevibacillus laterosporus TaxID=1465 RepID=UPI0014443B85|nr:hypothetical protein [Brevibacillus laterosporus]NKQ20664.1 hypothetical protein [Brevibacillus laterosporus]WNX29728.1 hypothetical protein RWW94_16005 [Brevibacillus laterosporus]
MNISDFDQLSTFLIDHTQILSEYMKKAQDVGFSRHEALQHYKFSNKHDDAFE